MVLKKVPPKNAATVKKLNSLRKKKTVFKSIEQQPFRIKKECLEASVLASLMDTMCKIKAGNLALTRKTKEIANLESGRLYVLPMQTGPKIIYSKKRNVVSFDDLILVNREVSKK